MRVMRHVLANGGAQNKHSESRLTMADDGSGLFYKGAIILGLTFVAGFGAGYEFHKWRLEWLKRRRERLALKLQETQKQIELMSKH